MSRRIWIFDPLKLSRPPEVRAELRDVVDGNVLGGCAEQAAQTDLSVAPWLTVVVFDAEGPAGNTGSEQIRSRSDVTFEGCEAIGSAGVAEQAARTPYLTVERAVLKSSGVSPPSTPTTCKLRACRVSLAACLPALPSCERGQAAVDSSLTP